MLGRDEEALRLKQDVYSGFLKLAPTTDEKTLQAANNYASCLNRLERFEEARSLLRRTVPVGRRVLGEGHRLTLKTRALYAQALHRAEGATLDDLREAVTTLEDAGRIARHVFGGGHPLTEDIGRDLRNARAVLRANEETQP